MVQQVKVFATSLINWVQSSRLKQWRQVTSTSCPLTMTHEDMWTRVHIALATPTYPHTQIRKVKARTKYPLQLWAFLHSFYFTDIVTASLLARCYFLLLLEHVIYGGLRQLKELALISLRKPFLKSCETKVLELMPFDPKASACPKYHITTQVGMNAKKFFLQFTAGK